VRSSKRRIDSGENHPEHLADHRGVESPPRTDENRDGRPRRNTVETKQQSAPILRTKLHRPPVTSDVVTRDRLLELLGGSPEAPLTLVSAPAGYGKSVLVSQWAEQLEYPSAWVSLGHDDSDLRLFLDYLLAAVETMAVGACPHTRSLLAAARR